MKKSILLLFSSALLLSSCGNKQQPESQPVVNAVDSLSATIDSNNAQAPIDVAGTYKGVLPTASAGGMEVTIVLTDSTYTKDVKYLGQKNAKPFNTKGTFTRSEDGAIVTLNDEDKPNQYAVEDGALRQLDIDGNKIEGQLADQYVLKK